MLQYLGVESIESQKLRRCRYKSRCNSTYCPFCLRQSGYALKDRLFSAASRLNPYRLRFATFTSKDVPLASLRSVGQQLAHTTRKVLDFFKVTGSAVRLETSFEDWGDDYHPHTHVLIDSPSSGRGFIPRQALQDEWLRQLPADLHPIEAGTHITPVRDLEEACYYMTKSPFFEHIRANAARTVLLLGTLKGIRRTSTSGSMRDLLT